jgi:predicted ABC-type ATPase
MNPTVYMIAGPNGAGKTTFAMNFLPHFAGCKNFINADLIAQGFSPFSPETVAIQAGRLMLAEIETVANRGVDFAFETTLSGRGHLKLIRGLKEKGYKIHFFYLWVPSVDITLSRVRRRVMAGGHNIPEVDVRRRYERSIGNFLIHYRPLADSWTLYDNSSEAATVIAFEEGGRLGIINQESFDTLIARYGSI